MKQLKVSLPDDLRERIEKASADSGLSLGEEIRRRLERTLDEDAQDVKTRELVDDIRRLAVMVFAHTHAKHRWHAHPKSHEALTEAVATWLEGLKPPPVAGEVA